MRLELQVNTVEQGKRLKELGVFKDASFTWVWDSPNSKWELSKFNIEMIELLRASNPIEPFPKNRDTSDHWAMESREKGVWPAFTVPELGELLPDGYATAKNSEKKQWTVFQLIGNWICMEEAGATEAEARANMLIYLVKNKPKSFDQELQEFRNEIEGKSTF